MQHNLKLGILASGHLGFKTVVTLYENGFMPTVLFTDKGSTGLIAFAREKTISLFIGNPRRGAGLKFAQDLSARPDLFVSINYLFLLDEQMITFPRLGSINVHGSLLPKYRGRTPHVWAIIKN
jgi:methionyl-tRNA formyltransferase